ncbi:3-ketosteroid reductase [Xylogone sp. PMI_703]|nr:3-ketosteroid reductase [Xylogone sp. PMI_703]
MGLPPWEGSDSQFFALITGANSGLGFGIATRFITDFITSPSTPESRHLVLILCTRSPLKTRHTISRLRAHLRQLLETSAFAQTLEKKAKEQGRQYNWLHEVRRVHFLGVEADLCDLKSVYALADTLVNGTVGSPDATTIEGFKLPVGSPGTKSYSKEIKQDKWALSEKEGSTGTMRSWGWGLSDVRVPRLDALILNAGLVGWKGLNWPNAIWTVLTDTVQATTYPGYNKGMVGRLIKQQRDRATSNDETDESAMQLLSDQGDQPEEPALGEVFCSNIFGHYILSHELMPLLSRRAEPSRKTGGRIIWISSVEAAEWDHIDIDDIQCLNRPKAYESSKRLSDVLALTAELPSVQRKSAPFFSVKDTTTYPTMLKNNNGEEEEDLVKPTMYVAHPGILATEIVPLPAVLAFLMLCAFYLARWLGSPWHTIRGDKAASAPVYLALSEETELEEFERANGKAKWGSAVDPSGNDKVMTTYVPGWGWYGKVDMQGDPASVKYRKKGSGELTQKEREDFEVLGGECWSRLEEMRKQWEGVLGVRKNA